MFSYFVGTYSIGVISLMTFTLLIITLCRFRLYILSMYYFCTFLFLIELLMTQGVVFWYVYQLFKIDLSQKDGQLTLSHVMKVFGFHLGIRYDSITSNESKIIM
jgi:hypothetical protein